MLRVSAWGSLVSVGYGLRVSDGGSLRVRVGVRVEG